MTPAETTSLAQHFERLHDEFGRFRDDFGRDVGEIKTACAVLVERSDRTERDVRDLRKDLDDEAQKRHAELDAVKRYVWLGAGIVLTLATVAGILVQFLTA